MPNQGVHQFFLIVCLDLLTCLSPVRLSTVQSDEPHWVPTETWSPCSTSCGPGTQYRLYQCIASDLYGVITALENKKCAHLPYPAAADSKPNQRECNLGSCKGYRWRVSAWGHCSQTCGGYGTMSRDVECVYTGRDGDIVIPERESRYYCSNYKRPTQYTSCNRFACKPEFVPDKWGKCIQSNPCRPGRQVRQVSCISIQINGSHVELPKAACYLLGRRQLPTWRRCFQQTNKKCELKQPVIDTDSVTVVQMRRASSLNLQVGQQAFLIPYTRLMIRCPVHYYSTHDIIWTHANHQPRRYIGPSTDRITVDKQGRLRIRSLRPEDNGEWRCIAGNQSAALNLNLRTPAAGFHDWVQRNRLWMKGMLSDDPKELAAMNPIVQWVEGPWSACSRSCGDGGEQHRLVRCERVAVRLYEILEDQVCLDKLLPKPPTKRKCLKSKSCPDWQIVGMDASTCTDKCLGVGRGSIKGNLTCQIGGRPVEEKACGLAEKPDMSCNNPICQIQWKVGPWSECSRSCGGVGVRARQLLCVWSHNEQSAGSQCYANQLPLPQTIDKCEAPPCKLNCTDMLGTCHEEKERCKFTLHRFQCCATCQEYFKELEDKFGRGRNP